MSNKKNRRNFEKFTKRERVRRTSAKNALLRTVEQLGVKADRAVITDKEDRVLRRAGSAHGTSHKTARGRFSSSRSGFGFVTVEGVERDIFIPEGRTMHALDGDIVEILYHSFQSRYGEEKTEGRVTRIVEYGRKTVTGTLQKNTVYSRHRGSARPLWAVVPDDRTFPSEVGVFRLDGAKVGDKVMVKLSRTSFPLSGEIVCVFGAAESKEANYDAILAEEGIEREFSPEALAEAEEAARDRSILEGRRDLSDTVILTIDGAGAKDLDDAVSVSRLKGGKYRLSVHIADVSSYIKPKGALERTAFSRGCSVYFVDQVVPMLPPVLSNGVCSLHPGEKKATLTATMILSPEGEIEKCTLERTLIESRVRGVYSEVNDLYEKGKQSEFYEKYKGVYPTLLRLLELYEILKKKSERRGAVELDTAESVILLDEQGAPKDILPAARGVAERIIEQMMLSANEGVATTLRALSLPCVYRVHENPPPDKMESFFSYLNSLDIRTGTVRPDGVTGDELNRFLAQAEEKGVKESVSYAMLRSMAKAKYSATECSHYGLGMECYCHFTSPIRRLSDLCVHRVISRVLLGEEAAKRYSSLAARGAAAATDGELRAVAAERRIENLYKVIYMEGRVGEVFSARVSSVNSFGVFAMLENTCEGLIPLSSMTGVFSFDEKRHRLVSRHRTYAVGDTIEVRLTEADRIRGKLAFADVRDEGAWREDE